MSVHGIGTLSVAVTEIRTRDRHGEHGIGPSHILLAGGRLATIVAALVTLAVLGIDVAQAAPAPSSCQGKLVTCNNNLNACTNNQNTLTGNLNACNNNETTCTNSVNSCMTTLSTCQNTLAAIQGGGTTSETRLLYSFVTHQEGFDTSITISNTSADPFGTAKKSGTCTLTFFDGSGNTQTVSTGNIAAGATYTTLASVTAPGFQGYMFADCGFDFAHGLAFVSEIGTRNLFAAYLPLVISKKARVGPEGLDH